MNFELEIEFSKADILHEIDLSKEQIDEIRPLPDDLEGRVMQKLRLDWNYNSNAIEGNKLSYGETVAFLMTGITAKGKPLKDHLDIRGHNEAIDFLLSLVKESRNISEADIRALHEMILVEPYDVSAQTADGTVTTKRINLGEYKKLTNHVKTVTGEIHYYSTPEETPAKMQELMEWYALASANKKIHPVVTASLFHHKFVSIHPFDDGNGRLSRILMNLILMRNGYPPVIIRKDDKQNYYALLSQADAYDSLPFIEYISGRLLSSMGIYIKAANGGDIDEDEDIDKEIELVKMQLNGGLVAKEKKSQKTIENIFFSTLLPLALKLDLKSKNFQEYFFSSQNWLRFNYTVDYSAKTSFEYINETNSEVYKKTLSDQSKDLQFIDIELGYSEYRNPENSFNVNTKIRIQFEKFYYRIMLDNERIVTKLYHEILTSKEEDKVIKNFVNNFKQQLNQNQMASNS